MDDRAVAAIGAAEVAGGARARRREVAESRLVERSFGCRRRDLCGLVDLDH
jgi:hypothetical protein